MCNSKGGFEIAGVPPGDYAVFVGGIRVADRLTIPDQPEFAVTLQIPGGALFGRVFDRATNRPLPQAELYLRLDGEARPDDERQPGSSMKSKV